MKKIIAILVIAFVALSAFETKESNMVLGMALLNDASKIDFKKFTTELQNKYGVSLIEPNIDEEKSIGTFKYKNSNVVVALVPAQIPPKELEFPIQVSYLWPEAKDLVPKHKGHVIISVTSTTDKKLDLYKSFTKVASAVLTTTNAFGIYLGSQTLVLSTEFYTVNANEMTDDSLPLFNWVYFGLRDQPQGKASGYTYGLSEFGLAEMEIVDSKHSKSEILDMLYNMSHYVVAGNVVLLDGETIGLTEKQKLKIKRSKGVQLDGETLKVGY